MHIRPSTTTIAIAILLAHGCQNGVAPKSVVGRASYAESPSGIIYFTNVLGELIQLKPDGELELLLKPAQGAFTDVDVSPDGRHIALALQPTGGGATTVIVLSLDDGLKEILRVTGTIPRFSHDGRQLLFARATRFVPQRGIGGNFWTDFKYYSLDIHSHDESVLINEVFLRTDDIATTESTTFASVSTNGQENIVTFDPEKKRVDILADCKSACNCCSGDPGISSDSKRLVFVSDRQQKFHYWLYVLNLDTNKEELVAPSKQYRMIMQPSFSRADDGAILALAASSFSAQGQPEYKLVKFTHDEVQVLVPTSVFVSGNLIGSHNIDRNND